MRDKYSSQWTNIKMGIILGLRVSVVYTDIHKHTNTSRHTFHCRYKPLQQAFLDPLQYMRSSNLIVELWCCICLLRWFPGKPLKILIFFPRFSTFIGSFTLMLQKPLRLVRLYKQYINKCSLTLKPIIKYLS